MGWGKPFKSLGKSVKKVSNFALDWTVNPFYAQGKKLVKGAKNLLPDQSNPNIETDTLRSDDYLEVLLGLCEGPIVGLEKGEESFFLGDTPLKNPDESKNFENYELEIKNGDASEDETVTFKMGGVADGEVYNREIPISENDKTSQDDERWYANFTTKSGNIDEIDVRIRIDALYYADDEGNVDTASGDFRIEYKKENEEEWTKFSGDDLYVRGKTTTTYYRDYNIPVTADDSGVRYQIRVTRLSPESSNSNIGYFFKFFVNQIEEVSKVYAEFKNTALAQFNVRTSEQINSIPQMYGIYKLLKIKVPSNYDPETHTYNGLWDGTFKFAWSNNPAWCLYDLIVNDRYGVNAYYEVTPDKWDFYEAGKYCDEMVDDGMGGKEPRYTFNYLITESQSGPDMLNQIASTFNAIVYEDSSGLVRLYHEDNEKSAVQIYNPTNITSEGFTYTFTDPSSRYNDFTVTFVNPKLNWEEDRRRVTTPYGEENIESFGRIPYDFNAIGCTKESEALRKARFMLITSLKETMTVTFSTNRSAMNVNLFDTILIADPDMGYSQTGRIKSISEDGSTVYLRDPVFLEDGRSVYEFQIQASNTVFRCNVINEERGKVTELKLDDVLPSRSEYDEDTGEIKRISLVDEKAVFTLTAPTVTNDAGESVVSVYGSPKPFRVMSISENQGDPDQITITALEIHRLKQTEADSNIELEDEDYYTGPDITAIPHVKDATFKEYFDVKRLENALQIGVELDWDKYPYYSGEFQVYSRLKGGSDKTFYLQKLEDGDIIYGHPSGLYEFKILPFNTLGMTPPIESAPIFEFNLRDIAAEPPALVMNFVATGNVENIQLTWDRVENAVRYEIRLGENWDTADLIEANVLPSGSESEEYFYTKVDTGNEYAFLIKAVNVAGLYSEYATLAYGMLSAPSDVKKFYVTPNLDSLRFDWETENENYVSYEIRAGAENWDSATTLFVSSGNNNTILNPGFNEETYFFIKGISRKGIYSEHALWAKIKQNLKQNRNVILKIDNAEGDLDYFEDASEHYAQSKDPWYGVTKGLVVYEIEGEGGRTEHLQRMLDGYYRAEHFFPVNIPNSKSEDTIARNWYETEFFKFGTRLKWKDLVWAWNSPEAKETSWLNKEKGEGDSGTIEPLITTAKNVSDYTNYFGLRFNHTVKDITNTVNPSKQYKIEYIDGKYDEGLAIYKAMKLNYNLVDLPQQFSLRFKINFDATIPDYIKLVRIANSNNKIYIDVYIEDYQLKVVRSDGVSVSDPILNDSYLDYMFIMVTQTADKLYLDYFIEYANIRKRLEVDCQPLTTFTKLYFGGRYD